MKLKSILCIRGLSRTLTAMTIATQGHETKHVQWLPAAKGWAHGEERICSVSSFGFLTEKTYLKREINPKIISKTPCNCTCYIIY